MSSLSLDAYRTAEQKLAERDAVAGLRVHALVTAIVMLALVAVNVFVADEFPWAIFPLVGMTIGLVAHWYFGVRHGAETLERHQRDVERAASAG